MKIIVLQAFYLEIIKIRFFLFIVTKRWHVSWTTSWLIIWWFWLNTRVSAGPPCRGRLRGTPAISGWRCRKKRNNDGTGTVTLVVASLRRGRRSDKVFDGHEKANRRGVSVPRARVHITHGDATKNERWIRGRWRTDSPPGPVITPRPRSSVTRTFGRPPPPPRRREIHASDFLLLRLDSISRTFPCTCDVMDGWRHETRIYENATRVCVCACALHYDVQQCV